MSNTTKQLHSTSGTQSKDSTRGAGSLGQATRTYSQSRKTQMNAQLLVVVGKRTQLPQSHVAVQDTPIEVPVNTWANMVTYLKGIQ